jgi:subtilase family serine protease
MKQILIPFLVACFLAPGSVWVSSVSPGSQISMAPAKRQVSGGLPFVADLAKKQARVPGFRHIGPLTVVLASRDPKGLQDLMAAQQNPASPQYHKWLTPQEFGNRFGRLPQEYAQLKEWLRSTGLRVSHQWPNRLQMTVEGPAEAVERAFDVQLDEYQLDDEVGFAANRLPSVPMTFSFIKGISGLHSFTRFQPMISEASLTTGGFQAGNTFLQRGPSNLMAPADIATVYNLKPLLDQGLDGSGVTIAVAARSDFNLSDPVAFRSQFNLPPKDPIKVFPFGPRPNRGGVEEV